MMHIEEMLLKALPKMRDAAGNEKLKAGLETYRTHCEAQAQVVREIFNSHSLPAREKKCDAMMGVLQRGQQFIVRSGTGPVLDAALLSVIFKIVGYKLGSYRSLVSWANAMTAKEVSRLLQRGLRSEEEADSRFEAFAAASNESAAAEERDSVRKVTRAPRRETIPSF